MSQPSDFIWGLVCGFPDPIRSNRLLLMLRAFIDDSGINQPHHYILGGWVAPAWRWAAFSDAWRDVLWMRPRIDYFKYSDAMNFSGEFRGISEESRNEKLILLINLVQEHNLVGLCSVIPDWIFEGLFGNKQGDISNAYAASFYGVIWSLLKFQKNNNLLVRTEFVFDNQPGQVDKVLAGWEGFRNSITDPDMRAVIGNPPTFQNDKETVALQAADLHVGWTRARYEAKLKGIESPQAPWGKRGNMPTILFEWTPEIAEKYYENAFGKKPIRQHFTFPNVWRAGGPEESS